MSYRKGAVKLSGRFVGVFEEIEGGTKFTYNTEWLSRPDACPVSMTMPLRAEPYFAKGVHPFFENLLPDPGLYGDYAKLLARWDHDVFGMILALCSDCIGAVEIEPLSPDAPASFPTR